MIIFKLAEKYDINKNTVIDSAFVVVLAAIAGGRIYHVFLELPFYMEHPLNIIMLWRGGLAIHGAIIAGLLAIYLFAKKHKLNPLLLASLYAPALALGQALGRWGNYFNQRRVADYSNYSFFHPTFLYESIGNSLIFIILFYLHKQFIKKRIKTYSLILACYLFLYSLLRFSLEFIRIDKTPELFGLRFPQIASLILISVTVFVFYKNREALKKLFRAKNSPDGTSDDISCQN